MSIKKRGLFMAAYFIFWLSYFFFIRAVFLLYHQELSTQLHWQTIIFTFLNGLRLDLSVTAGICLIPFLLISISAASGAKSWISSFLNYYTCFLIFLVTLLCTSDLELFRIWGFRLDASPLLYLNTPQEMMVSVGSSPLWLLILLNVLINLFFSQAYRQLLHPLTTHFTRQSFRLLPVYLSFTALLFILLPARRINAYFSDQHFANQAAINVPWNFVYSIAQTTNPEINPYRYLPSATASKLVKELYPANPAPPQQLVRGGKPNIVLIIWESLTAKAVGSLGGIKEVTPHFNALSAEGLLFSNFYASGDRSDKGLVAILSGRPALPTLSLLSKPEQTSSLPHLSQSLKNAGYHTAFYYGGDLDFASLRSYLNHGGFEQQVSAKDFKQDELNSPWGAHDEVVLQRLFNDIEEDAKESAPFFKVFFTLSSHEPFDFPGKGIYKNSGTTARFLNSLHYTDGAIGQFVEQAKTKGWYENTLFIILADHGHTYPGRSPVYSKEKFHIPMLWFGGALQSPPAVIGSTASQTDLAATLLRQLNIPAKEYRWSRDIFSPGNPAFAPCFFKEGVGLLTDSSYLSFDHVGRQMIEQEGDGHKAQLDYAKAYLQQSFGDYLNN
ncbi:LTA synthase family protein [Nafulsella turpanensis]|uniref:LTA synthase family protein n=1 Tax=Nafulsella turpanensis TaxID=1265690 RepID=UPI001268546E|nr:LTA synthase family protein [Nafulsella turpanensis]